jgi:hypothetical protein
MAPRLPVKFCVIGTPLAKRLRKRHAGRSEICPSEGGYFLISKMEQKSSYAGPERRKNRVFVTKNTEYHFRGDRCVAVRDRRSHQWLPSHLAIGRRLSGGVHFHPNGTAVPVVDLPALGEALYFADDGRELITSTVCGLERPGREVVSQYGASALGA